MRLGDAALRLEDAMEDVACDDGVESAALEGQRAVAAWGRCRRRTLREDGSSRTFSPYAWDLSHCHRSLQRQSGPFFPDRLQLCRAFAQGRPVGRVTLCMCLSSASGWTPRHTLRPNKGSDFFLVIA